MSSLGLWAVLLSAAVLISLGPILLFDLFVWIKPTRNVAQELGRQQRRGSDVDRANGDLRLGLGEAYQSPYLGGS